MPAEANMTLFHCNDEKRCLKFFSSDTYMIISQEEGKWLGSGMYFWDNLGNAKYWYSEKQRKNPEGKFRIVKARISLEHLLDLTDIDICKKLVTLWSVYQTKLGITGNEDTVELGKKLNLLYRCIPGFKDSYKVIKIYGKYNKTLDNGFFKYNLNSSRAEPTLSIKCIYNVKCKDVIMERELYEEVRNDG